MEMLLGRGQDLEREFSDLLNAYLLGWKTLTDLREWLSSVNWEEIDVESQLAATLGELDLLCTEALEGMRPEADFERRVSDLVAATAIRQTGSCLTLSVARPEIMISSSSSTAGFEAPVLSFWSRSPQEAPA
ncbi:MAG: hypothetical protein Q7T04_08240 [Dehalococcoidia bacterium]|nr:hypothetical protein [Dehalococcoidia bacterium]